MRCPFNEKFGFTPNRRLPPHPPRRILTAKKVSVLLFQQTLNKYQVLLIKPQRSDARPPSGRLRQHDNILFYNISLGITFLDKTFNCFLVPALKSGLNFNVVSQELPGLNSSSIFLRTPSAIFCE
jgi:hypothetical protein